MTVTIDEPRYQSLRLLVNELGVSRRVLSSYPKDHPLVATALDKTLTAYGQLMSQSSPLTIASAGTSLLLNNEPVSSPDRMLLGFMNVLNELGIGVLTLSHGLGRSELKNFLTILGLKREAVIAHGGIEVLAERANLTAIRIQPLRFDLFTRAGQDLGDTASTPEGLWERFAQMLQNGNLPVAGNQETGELSFDPQVVASALNRIHGTGAETGQLLEQIDRTMQETFAALPAGMEPDGVTFARMVLFVDRLNPKLRGQLISSAATIGDNQQVAKNLINRLPKEKVLEALEELRHKDEQLPDILMSLLSRPEHSIGVSRDPRIDLSHENLHALFREHQTEQQIPQEYQQKLTSLETSQRLSCKLTVDEHAQLKVLLEQTQLESKVCNILINIMSTGTFIDDDPALGQYLADMCTLFLNTGDYAGLITILTGINNQNMSTSVADHVHHHVACDNFLIEILKGLDTWGKAKYEEIGTIIRAIGLPFVPHLLDRLAVEEQLSLRRFIMERIPETGPAEAVAHLVRERLTDDRWYVLRNLIHLLRRLDDRESAPLLRPFLRHHQDKVRQEALRTLSCFGDPQAERTLLRDLESKDLETCLAAIRLIEKPLSSTLKSTLIELLEPAGFSARDCAIKSAAAQILADASITEALSPFRSLLAASSLLHPKLLAELKTTIITCLARYPEQAGRPLLEQISDRGGTLGELASRHLASYRGSSL